MQLFDLQSLGSKTMAPRPSDVAPARANEKVRGVLGSIAIRSRPLGGLHRRW